MQRFCSDGCNSITLCSDYAPLRSLDLVQRLDVLDDQLVSVLQQFDTGLDETSVVKPENVRQQLDVMLKSQRRQCASRRCLVSR